MVRRFKIIVSLILIIFMALSVSAFAESETSNQDMLDEILSAAPDDVANELSDVEIDAASPGSLADKLSFSSIMDMVVSAFKKAFSKQSKMLATVLTLVLFSVILKSFEDNFSGKSISTLLSTVSATAVILLAISALQNCVEHDGFYRCMYTCAECTADKLRPGFCFSAVFQQCCIMQQSFKHLRHIPSCAACKYIYCAGHLYRCIG